MFIQEFVGYDVVKTIVIVIATISLVVFVALFGRLPVFRRTPIAFLHKLFTKHIPNAFVWVDSYLTGRRLSRALFSTGHYLMYEKHPIVLIFFVLLQTLGELALVPQIWATISILHKLVIPITILLPHYFLYLTATTSPAIPLAPNTHSHHTPPSPTTSTTPPSQLHFGPAHTAAMHAYPYDYLLYHPGYFCSTCRFPKPARSKHCSLCKACIQKQDHHCIWVNNCVGRSNYVYFLALLVTITALLIYGVHLGWRNMAARLAGRFAPPGSAQGRSWATDTSWSLWFDRLAWAMVVDVRVGATTLLCAMCTPLGGAFLVYHAYLLWAGITTNEQGKWADWKEDVRDDVVFRAEIRELRKSLGEDAAGEGAAGEGGLRGGSASAGEQQLEVGAYPPLPREIEPPGDAVDWPPRRIPASLWEPADGVAAAHRPRWWYIRTRHGDQPAVKMGAAEAKKKGLRVEGYPGGEENGVRAVGGHGGEVEVEDMRWQRVLSMRREMDNVYDLGLWGNLMEVFYHRD